MSTLNLKIATQFETELINNKCQIEYHAKTPRYIIFFLYLILCISRVNFLRVHFSEANKIARARSVRKIILTYFPTLEFSSGVFSLQLWFLRVRFCSCSFPSAPKKSAVPPATLCYSCVAPSALVWEQWWLDEYRTMVGVFIFISFHPQIYVNLEEYDDKEYVNFDMKIDE